MPEGKGGVEKTVGGEGMEKNVVTRVPGTREGREEMAKGKGYQNDVVGAREAREGGRPDVGEWRKEEGGSYFISLSCV